MWEPRERSCRVSSKEIRLSTFRALTPAAIRFPPPTTRTSGAFIPDARWRIRPSTCQFSSTGLISGIANSSYNALEASLRKRFSHGLSFLASYTYSKAIDDVSSFNISGSGSIQVAGENDLAQNPFNLAAERGPSLFDARHRLVFSYQWSLPFWQHQQGWYQHVLGGWQLNGIATAMSGTPFTVFDSNDVSEQGGAPEITGFSANRPNLVAGQNPNAGPRKVGALAQCECLRANHAGPNLAGAAIWHGGPQHRARTTLRRLGFCRFKEYSSDGIQRTCSFERSSSTF